MANYSDEQLYGRRPSVTGADIVIDPGYQPSGFQQAGVVMNMLMQNLEDEEVKRQKKEAEKFDLYKTLRDAGYDSKSAHAAVIGGAKFPSQPPDETLTKRKEALDLKKEQFGLRKSSAEANLAQEKAAAYKRGDIGRRQTVADKMNAAQLQREIKRVSDPFENPDYDSEESQSYVAYLNNRLQQISQYPGAQTAQETSPVAAAQKPAEGKIRVRRKSDGKIGTVSAKFFDSSKYERA